MLIKYHVITWGKAYKLKREGAKRAERIFPDGLSMSQSLGWYLLNRHCEVIVHDSTGSVVKVLGAVR